MISFAAAISALVLPPLPRLDDSHALRASHGFSAAANWLIPGRVLLGANPAKGRGAALGRIMAIRLDGGCNTFVSLQAELPPIDSPDQLFPVGLESYAVDARSCADPPCPISARCSVGPLIPGPGT